MPVQPRMTADQIFNDGQPVRQFDVMNNLYLLRGHRTADEAAQLYAASSYAQRTPSEVVIPGSLKHTWSTFTHHDDSCVLVTGEGLQPGDEPYDLERDYSCCTCAVLSDELDEHLAALPADPEAPESVPVTWFFVRDTKWTWPGDADFFGFLTSAGWFDSATHPARS